MIKLTKSEIQQIINEEAEKVKKELLLRKELERVDKELKELNEVQAGGNMAPGPEGYHAGQKKPVFQKKGTHLIEKEDEMTDDSMAPVEPQMGDSSTEGGLDTTQIMDAIKELGQKLGLSGVINFDEVDDMGGEPGLSIGDDSIGVDIESGPEEAPVSGEESGEITEPESEEPSSEENIDETNTAPVAENAPIAEEQKVNESGVVEPSQTEQLKEAPAPVVSENKQSEPVKTKLTEEINRMKILAGII